MGAQHGYSIDPYWSRWAKGKKVGQLASRLKLVRGLEEEFLVIPHRGLRAWASDEKIVYEFTRQLTDLGLTVSSFTIYAVTREDENDKWVRVSGGEKAVVYPDGGSSGKPSAYYYHANDSQWGVRIL